MTSLPTAGRGRFSIARSTFSPKRRCCDWRNDFEPIEMRRHQGARASRELLKRG